MKLSYRPEIDGLRAFAVSYVLLFHFFPSAFKGGFVGVDVFFVISGYLITRILTADIDAGDFSIVRFYGLRARRIFPALLAVLVGTSLYAWCFLYPDQYVAVAKYVAGGASFVSNFVLWGEAGYFDGQAERKPLMHLWSLGIEEQFYIAWPWILLLISRTAKDWRGKLVGVIAVASFAYSLYMTWHNPSLAFFSPLSRSWELMCGAWLAINQDRIAGALHAKWLARASTVGTILLCVLPFVIHGGDTFPGWQALLPVTAAFLIIMGARSGWTGSKLLAHPVLVYVGLISYPLYLWHWVVLVMLKEAMHEPSRLYRVGALLLSVLLAHLTYTFIEMPLRKLKVSRRLVLTLSTCMAAVLIVSFSSYQWGFLVREMSSLRAGLSRKPDIETAYRSKLCFLDSKVQSDDAFAPECMPKLLPGQRELLIWGDSLAAHLYPGLNAVKNQFQLGISQRTSSSCPPGMAEDLAYNGHCDDINAASRRYIEEHRPYMVVINGRWENGVRSPAEHIAALAAFLKGAGVKKVLLVGPTPRWSPDLRLQLLDMKFTGDVLPTRMNMDSDSWRLLNGRDEELARIARQEGVLYASPLQQFCRDGSCQIRVSEQMPDGLVVVDYDHFTAPASMAFVESPVMTAALQQ